MTEETQQPETPVQNEAQASSPDVGKLRDNKKEKCKPITKVIIRRLPPTITSDQLMEQISPLPEYDYFYFVKADMSLGQYAFSRAYINFVDQQDIFTFKEKFDNYVFVDSKGAEYSAVVEFSPFQRLPKKRVGKKKDLKCGTIESDSYYISFLESRKNQEADSTNAQPKTEYSYQPADNTLKKVTTTPLLEYLKQRKQEKQRLRDEKREERRRRELERRRIKDDPVISKPVYNVKDVCSKYCFIATLSCTNLDAIHFENQIKNENKVLSMEENNNDPILNGRLKIDNKLHAHKELNCCNKFANSYIKSNKNNVSLVKKYIRNNTKHYKFNNTYDLRKENYMQNNSELNKEKRSYHWCNTKNNFIDNKHKFKSGQCIGRNEYFSMFSETQFRNIHNMWKLHTTNDTFNSRNHNGVLKNPDLDKDTNKDNKENKDDRDKVSPKDLKNRNKRDEKLREKVPRDRDLKPLTKGYRERMDDRNKDRDIKHQRRHDDKKLYGRRDDRDLFKEEKKNDIRDNKNYEIREDFKESKERRIEEKKGKSYEKMRLEKKRLAENKRNNTDPNTDNVIAVTCIMKENQNITQESTEEGFISSTSKGVMEFVNEKNDGKNNGNIKLIENELDIESISDQTKDTETSIRTEKDATEKSRSIEHINRETGIDTESEEIKESKVVKRRSSLESGSDGGTGDNNCLRRHKSLDGDGQSNLQKSESEDKEKDKKDPRLERRIRNKDRPAMEIYRPGMGKFSKQRLEREKSNNDDRASLSQSPTPNTTTSSVSKTAKSGSEVRSMTFKRSVSRDIS
ncbi:hypothetical protein M0804_010328 [Polistes exclamans]|nr:hypothetical protein M0804_010328 [Polistes exclamans]